MWIRDAAFGVDFRRLVHSAQAAEYHALLPASADVVGSAKVISLTDRGEGRGAVLELERQIADAAACSISPRRTSAIGGGRATSGPGTSSDRKSTRLNSSH